MIILISWKIKKKKKIDTKRHIGDIFVWKIFFFLFFFYFAVLLIVTIIKPNPFYRNVFSKLIDNI